MHQTLEKRLPTKEEIRNAASAATALAIAMEMDDGIVINGQDGSPVTIAPTIGRQLIELLGHISNGEMVTLVPTGAMLTTQQAADMLNVSRPFLIKLIKRGEIECETVGSHRRIKTTNLMDYRERRSQAQHDAMAQLVQMGQEAVAKGS